MVQHTVTAILLLYICIHGASATADPSAVPHKAPPTDHAAARPPRKESGINMQLGFLNINIGDEPTASASAPGSTTHANQQDRKHTIAQHSSTAATAQYDTQLRLYKSAAVSSSSPLQHLADGIGIFFGGLFGVRVSSAQQSAPAAPPGNHGQLVKGMSGQQVPQTAAVQKPSKRLKPVAAVAVAAAVRKPIPTIPDGHLPMCEWRQDFAGCMIGRKYLLAIPGKPQSFASRLVSAAAARDHICAAFNTPNDCLQQSTTSSSLSSSSSTSDLLCDWNMGGVTNWDKGCHSVYLTEWTLFATLAGRLGAVNASHAMAHAGCLTCPGSMAQQTLACSSLYPMSASGHWMPDICKQGVGCTFNEEQHSCTTSSTMDSLVATLEPHVVGTCSAACYLRMLKKCSEASRRPPSTRQGWCNKQPGCRWNPKSSKCNMDVWLSKLDTWGKQAAATADKCAQQEGEYECAVAGALGALPQVAGRVQQFVKQPVGHGALSTKCPV